LVWNPNPNLNSQLSSQAKDSVGKIIVKVNHRLSDCQRDWERTNFTKIKELFPNALNISYLFGDKQEESPHFRYLVSNDRGWSYTFKHEMLNFGSMDQRKYICKTPSQYPRIYMSDVSIFCAFYGVRRFAYASLEFQIEPKSKFKVSKRYRIMTK
jgi:hypothetical protein